MAVNMVKYYFLVLVFLLIWDVGSSPTSAAGQKNALGQSRHASQVLRHRPMISESVGRKIGTAALLPVIIKLKESSESSELSRSARSRHPSKFISKKDIKTLQSNLKSTFTAQEHGRDIYIRHKLSNMPWITGRINQKALNKLSENPNVAAIVEDLPVRGLLYQSGQLINSSQAFVAGYTGEGVTVAVLDTGIDTDHPDLADDLVAEACFLYDNSCPGTSNPGPSGPGRAEDGNGHGTHIAGVITSSHHTYRGVAPDAGIVAVKVLDNSANGYFSDIIAGIDWVVDNKDMYGIDIINLSLGGDKRYSGACDDAQNEALMAAAIDVASEAGITIFAASGNEGLSSEMLSPACLSSTVSVGSVYDAHLGSITWGTSFCSDTPTNPDKVACSSNVSRALDLLAPGAFIDSSSVGGGTKTLGGTSMATAHASGVAALLLSKNPDLAPVDVVTILKTTGVSVSDDRIGLSFPRIDAMAALNYFEDSDLDGFTDGVELNAKSNPQDINSQPGLTSLVLKKGYNQVTIPADIVNYSDFSALLQAIGGSSVIEKVEIFDSISQVFYEAGYDTSGNFYGENFPLSDSQSLTGLIIYAKQDRTINFTSKYCQTWDLKTGTNLVGSGCERDPVKLTAHELLNDLGPDAAVSVQEFIADEAVFNTVNYGSAGVPIGKNFIMNPGMGYFVRMKQDVPGYRP